jgi:hypothetical protein
MVNRLSAELKIPHVRLGAVGGLVLFAFSDLIILLLFPILVEMLCTRSEPDVYLVPQGRILASNFRARGRASDYFGLEVDGRSQMHQY